MAGNEKKCGLGEVHQISGSRHCANYFENIPNKSCYDGMPLHILPGRMADAMVGRFNTPQMGMLFKHVIVTCGYGPVVMADSTWQYQNIIKEINSSRKNERGENWTT